MPEEKITVCERSFDVLRLLGHGKGGYSCLVADSAGEYVAKRIHHEPCEYYSFGDKLEAELRDYSRLAALGVPMPKLLAADRQREIILKEYIVGETVYELVLRGALPPELISQMNGICARLYAANTNIDYFPTNFIPRGGTLYYIDYECNDYMPEWSFESWGVKYWSQTAEFLRYAAERGDVRPV